jgi:sulfopyruvate decarboxylase TPP-binding subunit
MTMAAQTPKPIVGYREDAARVLYEGLKANGVNFAVFLPDTVLHVVDKLLLADPDIQTVVCSREDEGIAIAMGAYWAGKKPVVLMEGSGYGLSGLILARGIVQRSPVLLISSHNSVLGERFNYHAATRLVAQPTLDALRIPYHVLRDAEEIPTVVREVLQTISGQRLPAAILVPRHVLIEG